MKKGKVFRSCYILTLTVFITFGAALAVRLTELRRGDEFYAQAAGTGDIVSSVLASPQAIQPPSEDRRDGIPEVPELSARLVQFAEAYPDAAFWLQIPDTPLNYPVMLGADNQFYLNHLPDGNKNALGSLFLDYRTDEDSVHLIIYGHNGTGGKMFGLLKQYESQDYFAEHKALTLATVDRVYVCPIFSVRRVEAGGGAYQLTFEADSGLPDYIDQAAAESLYPIEADGKDAAGMVTLSTCTGQRNHRFVVQALIPG